jgi:hypothetical protein
MLLQDSVATPMPVSQVHQIFANAVPNVWVMGGLTIGLFVLILYMLRVPHDYPFRGAIVAFSSMGFLACAILTGMKLWKDVPHQLPNVPADIKAIEQHHADKEPVGALDTYVAPMPGADSMTQREQPEVGGLPSGTIWDETTTQSTQDVVKYYSDDANHPGWQLELSAPDGVVLRRVAKTASGDYETERMRIQAHANPNHQSSRRTEIEFELTRRLK